MKKRRQKKLKSDGKRPAKAPSAKVGHSSPFPIVGVGASAGGLEAFMELLKHLPTDTGFGFVLVQHLDPEHESALTQLLARSTTMPVREVTNNLGVEPNQIYVIPPNAKLSIAQGVLKLEPRGRSRMASKSIDSFFESLAQDQKELAMGVILSGTATDGTVGLEAIKAEGGITFAQDDSARYDSMPRSAVAAGCVDFVLKPEEIAREFGRIAKHPYLQHPTSETVIANEKREIAPSVRTGREKAETAAKETGEDGYKRILLLLRSHCGVDFSLYKSSTIQRRIHRRTLLNKQQTLQEYTQFLRGNVRELDALYSDALISVTSFFRNPEAFEVLRRKVFPKILEERGDDPVRVWVLGCSGGQEAYSIAMIFTEMAETAPRSRKLQVFATDLNESLLDKARHGLYPRNLVDGVSPERLRRFFVEEQGGYRVAKPLREMVVFARQNLIADPPFSRIDLISCRNVLIYLEPSAQKKALRMFHYALKPEGFLFLGASESIGGFTDLFEPADKKQKIYSKKPASGPALQLPLEKVRGEGPAFKQTSFKALEERPEALMPELNAQREADRVMVNQFAPPSVLINSELKILQFRGPTAAYLQPPTGTASFDILKMAREGLMLPLRATIQKAKRENKPARSENVRVTGEAKTRTVNLEVIPLKNLRERCFLVLFQDADKARSTGIGRAGVAEARRATSKKDETRRVEHLETELSETRDYLQSIQEQHEAANEELQASNEEVQSANEELQSINEELETSKEELESANEELLTVNEEMANRNTELTRLNNDLVNLQTSTRLVILLLGRDLTIRRFSVQAEKQFNLLATDIGRPIGSIRHNLGAELEGLVGDVIKNVREREREVQDKAGRWFSLRVRPYLTMENKVDGAVLVMMDINDLKKTDEERKAAQERAETTSAELHYLSRRLNTAHEEERQRIGREIHDEVGQTLTGLKLYLQEIKEKPSRKSLTEAQKIASEAQQELRRISLNLHPQVLSDFGLKKALEWRVKRFQEHTGVHVELRCPEIPKDVLTPQVGITAYRIVQEALTNVAKHSGSNKAAVNIKLEDHSLRLQIRDWGKGFVVHKENSALSSGIRGMNDRALLEGGTFEVISNRGKGAEILVSLPTKPIETVPPPNPALSRK